MCCLRKVLWNPFVCFVGKVLWNPFVCCFGKVLWNSFVCCLGESTMRNPFVLCGKGTVEPFCMLCWKGTVEPFCVLCGKVLWNLESILITWYNGDSFESPEDPECAESRQIPQVNAHREVPAKRKGSHCVCVLCTVRK